jgi:hypothetical protein
MSVFTDLVDFELLGLFFGMQDLTVYAAFLLLSSRREGVDV